jgi:ferredoxin
VNMPNNLIPPDQKKIRKLDGAWKKKLETIVRTIQNGLEMKLETDKPMPAFANKIGKSYYLGKAKMKDLSDLPFYDVLPKMDRTFRLNAKCDGCGICSKVCPVGNIVMKDKKPEWHHRCEHCHACLHWCPKEAITGGIVYGNKRYHHIDVKLQDMFKN